MDQSLIIELRKKIQEYFEGNDVVFTFKTECPVHQRIKFIYAVVFPGIKKYSFYVRFSIARIAQWFDLSPIKVFLYRLIGVKIGTGVFISPDVIIDPHFPWTITLRDYCILGWGAKLFSHEYMDNTYRIGRIVIDEAAIVGAYAMIRGGTKIGKGAEVPYGSIIIKDVESGTKSRQIIKEILVQK